MGGGPGKFAKFWDIFRYAAISSGSRFFDFFGFWGSFLLGFGAKNGQKMVKKWSKIDGFRYESRLVHFPISLHKRPGRHFSSRLRGVKTATV